MEEADISTPARGKIGVAIVVVLLHVIAIFGLIRAFAPGFVAEVTDQVLATFTVQVTAPPPPPPPPAPEPEKAGAQGAVGKKATPKEAAAPRPKVDIARKQAPAKPGKGDDTASGARDAGQGTGAGGQGNGSGAGNGGDGSGGGAATKAEKIAGDINSARDYPRASRDLRLGSAVTVAITVGTDGRAKGCRIVRPSKDPEADRITCQLATQRFRFRPATDRNGNAVESVYGWQQRWWNPRD